MRKFFFSVILAATFPLVSGCSINTNIPLFYGAGTTVEVINNSDYAVSITVNGYQQTFECRDENGRTKESPMLMPNGPSGVMHITNWSGYGQRASLAVRGWNGREAVGADAVTLGVDSYRHDSIVLMVANDQRSGVRIDYPGGSLFRW